MRAQDAVPRGAIVAAACAACCAPPLIGALGVTAGVAAAAGVFLGLAATVAVVLLGVAWIAARRKVRHRRETIEPVPVPAPTVRGTRSLEPRDESAARPV